MDRVGKVLSLEELLKRLAACRSGKGVVFTNGCFDLLHLGHIRYLRQARELGDLLVIGLNSDASTRRIKGPLRPLVPAEERAETLAALEFVDFVILFDDTTAEGLISLIKPDVYVKGGDYAEGKALPEADIVREYGGRVEILPIVEGRSTTNIVETILRRYEQTKKDENGKGGPG